MNTVETQHSPNKNKGPIIRFGTNDDNAEKVKNVNIVFIDGTKMDVSKGQSETSYDRITVIKSCDGLQMLFYVNNNHLSDEMFIPIHRIATLMVKNFTKNVVETKVTKDIKFNWNI